MLRKVLHTGLSLDAHHVTDDSDPSAPVELVVYGVTIEGSFHPLYSVHKHVFDEQQGHPSAKVTDQQPPAAA